MTYRAGKAWNVGVLRPLAIRHRRDSALTTRPRAAILPGRAPLPRTVSRGAGRAHALRRRAPTAEGQEDQAQGSEGAVGPRARRVLTFARSPPREARVAFLVVLRINLLPDLLRAGGCPRRREIFNLVILPRPSSGVPATQACAVRRTARRLQSIRLVCRTS